MKTASVCSDRPGRAESEHTLLIPVMFLFSTQRTFSAFEGNVRNWTEKICDVCLFMGCIFMPGLFERHGHCYFNAFF